MAEHAGYVDIRQGLYDDIDNNPNGVALHRGDDPILAARLAQSDSKMGHVAQADQTKIIIAQAGRDFGIHGYFNANRNEALVDGNVDSGKSDHRERRLHARLVQRGKTELGCATSAAWLIPPRTNSNWRSFIPVGLFSHSDEQRNWMTAMPETQSQNIGFLGRAADMLTRQGESESDHRDEFRDG